MKHDHFVVQSPDKPAQQLLLLFHGVGDNPVAMGEIGSWFAPLFPDAQVYPGFEQQNGHVSWRTP
ncbi:hypothetical protein AWG36_18585 [Escherichia coli]|nr:hypothetical protein AWG36_18585 [Escherichia coli]KZH58277.1 hypothetical protein AWG49_06720 [Escherichia coli]